jgi:hypothetical protein
MPTPGRLLDIRTISKRGPEALDETLRALELRNKATLLMVAVLDFEVKILTCLGEKQSGYRPALLASAGGQAHFFCNKLQ